LYLASVAGKWGLADYYASQSYEILTSWRTEPLTDESWQAAHDALAAALSLDPTHPTYHHRMGRLYHLRMRMDPLHRQKWGDLAKQDFHASLDVRPYWPLTWANLALVKRDLAEFDGEMMQALVNAAKYGPWEPGVHEMLAEIGLPYLPLYSGQAKAAIVGSITRGLRSPVGGAPRRVLHKIEQYQDNIDRETAAGIEQMLLNTEWTDSRETLFSHLVLMLWNDWSPSARQTFIHDILGSADQPRVLQLIDQYEKLGIFCPRLPRDRHFAKFCSDRRIL